jgi:L-ascorbate metabolism protein UlaG (beta-lactamase superfamily)
MGWCNLGRIIMKIRWHGHSCFEVSDKVTVVTDPHDGKSIGIRPPKAKGDIIFVSHEHTDHSCVRSVKRPTSRIYSDVGEFEDDGIEIFGIPSYHDNFFGEKRGKNTIFKFKLGGTSFCHLGDIGHIPDKKTLRKIGKVDVLFIPVGNIFTLDISDAWTVVQKIKPHIAIPMHFRIAGLSMSIKPVEHFLDKAVDEFEIIKVGNECEFEKEDIQDVHEVWVFTI